MKNTPDDPTQEGAKRGQEKSEHVKENPLLSKNQQWSKKRKEVFSSSSFPSGNNISPPNSPQEPLKQLDQGQFAKENPFQSLLKWVGPICVIAGFTLLFYLLHAILDFRWKKGGFSFFEVALTTNEEAVSGATGAIIELLAAIFGVMVTVVAIVVQLAAQRYGNKLVDLFIKDKVNVGVFFFMVFSLLYAVFVVFGIKKDFFPYYGIHTMMFLTVLELSMLIPYFDYVFKFLTPVNIISSIRNNNRSAVLNACTHKDQNLSQYQREMATGLEQITDTVLSSNEQKDRTIGLMALNNIKEIILDYQQVKPQLGSAWFKISHEYFLGISNDFLKEIQERQVWVEVKAFMDMQLVFQMSLGNMPDAISAIALNTREIGENSIQTKDSQLLNLVIEFFNTYLRISLNSSNLRAMFGLFYQYRLLGTKILAYDMKLAEKIVFYFKYYGQVAMQKGMWFALTTSSFDIGKLIAEAYDQKVLNISNLLDIFLEVDDDLDPVKDFLALTGVRKSQLILAAYLTSRGDKVLVQKIVDDLKKQDSFDYLVRLRNELLAVQEQKFWEVTDRRINLEYIDKEQKKSLEEFYNEMIFKQRNEFKQ